MGGRTVGRAGLACARPGEVWGHAILMPCVGDERAGTCRPGPERQAFRGWRRDITNARESRAHPGKHVQESVECLDRAALEANHRIVPRSLRTRTTIAPAHPSAAFHSPCFRYSARLKLPGSAPARRHGVIRGKKAGTLVLYSA